MKGFAVFHIDNSFVYDFYLVKVSLKKYLCYIFVNIPRYSYVRKGTPQVILF